jgi:hypothetical protein
MYKNRDVIKVIEELNKFIPDSEETLKYELNNYLQSLWNKAPEVLRTSYCWEPLIKILNKFIPNLSENWHFQIQKIISNK